MPGLKNSLNQEPHEDVHVTDNMSFVALCDTDYNLSVDRSPLFGWKEF